MPKNTVVDIQTGLPVEEATVERPELYAAIVAENKEAAMVEPAPTPQPSREEQFQELCQNIGLMLQHNLLSLDLIIAMAGRDTSGARNLKWVDANGMTISVPYALRTIRMRIEWLENFYKRGNK